LAIEDVRASGAEKLGFAVPTRSVILSGFDCSQSAQSSGLTAEFAGHQVAESSLND
jgi:hypothetical protein